MSMPVTVRLASPAERKVLGLGPRRPRSERLWGGSRPEDWVWVVTVDGLVTVALDGNDTVIYQDGEDYVPDMIRVYKLARRATRSLDSSDVRRRREWWPKLLGRRPTMQDVLGDWIRT